MKEDVLIVIPARLAATRLPNKPLAMINDAPMIVHVLRRAHAANIGKVVVACDAPAIADAVQAAGGEAVLTRPDHPSGSDRIAEALDRLDPEGHYRLILNVQGDLPTIAPTAIAKAVQPLTDPEVDVATLAVEITEEAEKTNPNVVKVVGAPLAEERLRALYFTRATAPYGPGPLYHHIGLYAFRREALEKMVRLPPSALEKREKLEQLRLLEAGMRIDVMLIDAIPLGVDTPADLERARHMLLSL